MLAWVTALLLWVSLPLALAQNLVVNGSFNLGATDGWQGGGGGFGYVNVNGNSWIGLSGQIYQDVATVPGQVYALNFQAQVYDPSQVWSPNSLQVFWGDTLVSRFDFAKSDTRWFRPRLLLRATNDHMRLRFVGDGFPSLDEVRLVPAPAPFYLGRLTEPAEGAQFTEGDTVTLRSEWEAVGVPGALGGVSYLLNGETTLGIGTGTGSALTWTNVPPGTYYLCGEAGSRTAPVRIVINTRPKLSLEAPLSRAVFDLGTPVHLQARLLDNHGDGEITQVRYLVNDILIQLVPVAGATVATDWLPPGEGSYRVTAVGEQVDGTESFRNQVSIDVLRPAIIDQDLGEGGNSVNFQPATPIAQTFTAGVSGRLRAVELYGGNNGAQDWPVTVSVRDVVDGHPGTNLLGETTLTFPETRVPGPIGEAARYTFASNRVVVIAGRQYSIVCETHVPAAEASYFRAVADTYPGGKLWQKNGATWIAGYPLAGELYPADLAFQSYVIPFEPPTVTLTAPAPLAEFAADTPINLTASPTAGENPVARVIFLADGQPLATVEQPPFQFAWTQHGSGNHVVQAVVEDGFGVSGVSESVSVLVGLDIAGLPRLRVEDTASPEGNSSIPPLVFRLSLSAPSTVPVTVEYATRDLTAVAAVDYLAAAGTATFAPGQTQAFVFVRMLGDLRDEPNKRLRLELVNPQGAILERPSAIGTIVDDDPGLNKVTHFTWELATNRVAALEPFTVALVALDNQENVVQDVPGNIRLALAGASELGRVEPAEISGFTNGRWTGQVVLTAVGAGLHLTATDILGHVSVSPVLESGPTDTLRIQSFSDPEHPTLELIAPLGRSVLVQASDDLLNWVTVSEALRPEGLPLRWQLPASLAGLKFFRLFLLE